MPIPRIVRQWNKAGLNGVTRHVGPLGTRHGDGHPSRPPLRPPISNAGQRVRRRLRLDERSRSGSADLTWSSA